MTWMMGIIGILILVVIYFGIAAVYRDSDRLDDADKYQAEAELPVEAMERAAKQQIQTNTWMTVENAEGVKENRWTIPIDRSMELMAQQLRRDQSTSLKGDLSTVASNNE